MLLYCIVLCCTVLCCVVFLVAWNVSRPFAATSKHTRCLILPRVTKHTSRTLFFLPYFFPQTSGAWREPPQELDF